MKVSDTDDDAAPMTAWTPSAISAFAACVAMFVDASPESFCSYLTVRPALASLMSLTAAVTPAISGGPSWARVPVVGRIEPSFSVRADEPPEEDDDDEEEEPPPFEQAARTTA